MTRLAPTADFVTTTTSTALAAAGTTMTIGTGLDLPATNGILQIHYDSAIAVGTDEGPETVFYASYNSGSGAVAGMTRGEAGTTDVAHASGATVQQGSSAAFFGEGMILNADLSDVAGEPGGAWKAWTPSWTNLTVGSGTVEADYVQIGKTIIAHIYFKFGAGSAIGGEVEFTLPVTAVDLKTKCLLGHCYIEDAATTSHSGSIHFSDTTKGLVRCANSAGTYLVAASLASNVPMTWATNDIFNAIFAYEAA